MEPSGQVWADLSVVAEGGDLFRLPTLDAITLGWPVRATGFGWGYATKREGCLEFPDRVAGCGAVLMDQFYRWMGWDVAAEPLAEDFGG